MKKQSSIFRALSRFFVIDLSLKTYSFTYIVLFQITFQNCDAHQTMFLRCMKTQNVKSVISAELSQDTASYCSAPNAIPETPPARSKMDLPEAVPARQCLPWGGSHAASPPHKKSQHLSENSGKHNRGLKRVCAMRASTIQRFGPLGLLDKMDINFSLSVGSCHRL